MWVELPERERREEMKGRDEDKGGEGGRRKDRGDKGGE